MLSEKVMEVYSFFWESNEVYSLQPKQISNSDWNIVKKKVLWKKCQVMTRNLLLLLAGVPTGAIDPFTGECFTGEFPCKKELSHKNRLNNVFSRTFFCENLKER